MAKRKKRRGRGTTATSRRTEPTFTWDPIPSAQTFFRYHLLSPGIGERTAQLAREVKPETWERDREDVERIERAATVEELLDLAPIAAGLADPVWHRRMREFGPEVAPIFAARLKQARDIEDEDARAVIYEHLLDALRWKGGAGAAALLECFDHLDDYGKSLACVVLGRLDAQESADTLWAFYQRVKDDPGGRFFVGPLWGLVDFEDPRAADALAELLWAERFFYSIFAMAHRAGDARVLLPLVYLFDVSRGRTHDAVGMALMSLAHRIEREAARNEFQRIGADPSVARQVYDTLVDQRWRVPLNVVEEYFAIFYQEIHADSVNRDEVQEWLGQLDRQGPAPAMPGRQDRQDRPGRNDPCWCGSGKKYKHCHWRQDRYQG